MWQLQLWQNLPGQRQVFPDKETKTIPRLNRKMQNRKSDYSTVVAELEEQRKYSQSFHEKLQFQQNNATTLSREMHSRKRWPKWMSFWVCTSNSGCRKSPTVSQSVIDSVSWVSSNKDQGRTQEGFVRLQRAHHEAHHSCRPWRPESDWLWRMPRFWWCSQLYEQ